MENQRIEVNVVPGTESLNIYSKVPFERGSTSFKLDTIDAIAELVKFRGNQDGTIILYNDEKIGVILDERITVRSFDKGYFEFEQADKAKEWGAILGKALTQKQFVEFLKIREPGEVADLDQLLGQIQFIQFGTLINGDFNYEDKNNITMMVKIKDTETTAKIPQQIAINIPAGSL